MGPLVGLLIGLGKQALDEQQKAAEEDRAARHQEAQIQADIRARRAARAGDSGYIQSAMSASRGLPVTSNASFGKSALALGAGLLAQNSANSAEEAADQASRRSWRLEDDDLIDPWSK